MSEYFDAGGEMDQSAPDSAFEVARNAVFYRDLERASETFNLLEALKLILHSIRTGTELDCERLSRLVIAFTDDEPQLDAVYDDDGYLIYYDEGKEVRREAPSPHLAEYFANENARRKITTEYTDSAVPGYVENLKSQLDDPTSSQATFSKLIERGRRDGEVVSRNELEQAALGATRDQLREHGYTVAEVNRRVGSDGSPDHPKPYLTHTLRTLIVTRSSE